eukprot:TRINITY_DN65188_c0_g1_i1.p1 TRINITY_DN65188_c0_g1~~TRINITY_DN65188_c0_g1_i1.p1  ORF type:complete len:1050 (+),score=289.93 TRINITY_DN65188_c0_g1_i1:94-3243(+)
MLVNVEGFDTIINILGWLATPAGDSKLTDVKLPPTVVYRNGVPRECVQWHPERGLTLDTDLALIAVQRALLGSGVAPPQGKPHDLAAVAINRRDDNMLGNRRPYLTVDYFTDDRLRYLLDAPPAVRRDVPPPPRTAEEKSQVWTGLLQRFVMPQDECNHCIEVHWSTDSVHMESRRNIHKVCSREAFPFQRAATFEGPLYLSTADPHIPAKHVARVKEICRSIADHLRLLTLRGVVSMLLYFKIDREGDIWLLWCRQLCLHGDSKEAPPRFRVPGQYRARLNVQPKPTSTCILEEDLIADPVIPPAGDAFYLPCTSAPIAAYAAKRRAAKGPPKLRLCRGAQGWASYIRSLREQEAEEAAAAEAARVAAEEGTAVAPAAESPAGKRRPVTAQEVLGSSLDRPLDDIYDRALLMVLERPVPKTEACRRALWSDSGFGDNEQAAPTPSVAVSPPSPQKAGSPLMCSNASNSGPTGGPQPSSPSRRRKTTTWVASLRRRLTLARDGGAQPRRARSKSFAHVLPRFSNLTASQVLRRIGTLQRRRQRQARELAYSCPAAPSAPPASRRVARWLCSAGGGTPLLDSPEAEEQPDCGPTTSLGSMPASLAAVRAGGPAGDQGLPSREPSVLTVETTTTPDRSPQPFAQCFALGTPSPGGSPQGAPAGRSRARSFQGSPRGTPATGRRLRSVSLIPSPHQEQAQMRRGSALTLRGGSFINSSLQRSPSGVGITITPQQSQRNRLDVGNAQEGAQQDQWWLETGGVRIGDEVDEDAGGKAPTPVQEIFPRMVSQGGLGKPAGSFCGRRRRSSIMAAPPAPEPQPAPPEGEPWERELPGWVELALSDFDAEFTQNQRGGGSPVGRPAMHDAQLRCLALVRQGPQQRVQEDPALLEEHRKLAASVEQCVDFLDGLCYHLAEHRRSQGPRRPFVFSVHPGLGALGRMVGRLFSRLKHLRRRSPEDAEEAGLCNAQNLPPHLAMDEQYSAHTGPGYGETKDVSAAALTSAARMAIWEIAETQNPQQLSWATNDWVLRELRGYFLLRGRDIAGRAGPEDGPG